MKTSNKIFIIITMFVFTTGYSCSQVENKGDMGGWFKAGSKPDSYEIGLAMKQHEGKAVYYIKSTEKHIEGFGTIMTGIKPDEYFGKRVKLSGWIRTEDVANHVGMWMRVDGSTPNEMLAFDNMYDRPIKGTTDWQKYEIVLDVDVSAAGIAYGVLINGTGTAWLSDLAFEVVGSDIPTTVKNENNELNGWFMGSKPELFDSGLAEEKYNGSDVYFLKSKNFSADELGTFMKNIKPGDYKNKRLRVSAFIKHENIENWAGMWMRVDSYVHGKMLGFDNMSTRPLKGTGDWQKYEIVLDVPDYSSAVYYGLLIEGNGQLWIAEPSLEVVGNDVASTNTLTEEYYKTFKNSEQMPPELEKIPNGIEVGHNPQTVSAVYNDKDSMYYWVYKTTVKPVHEDIEITQFGSYYWAGDHWQFGTVTGKPFDAKDFADWYKCKDAKMKKGKEYSDKNNWNNARVLQGGKTLWYYIGKNKKGEFFKGTAIVNSLPEMKKK
jgi:hypothetical protein